MDRRYRYRALLGGTVGGLTLLFLTIGLAAQVPSVPPTPGSTPAVTAAAAPSAATATPWVQAPPPSTVPPARVLRDKALAQVPTEVLAASPSKEDVARAMARKREEELAGKPPAPLTRPPRAMPQLTPEEKEAYERNLTLWLALPPEERVALRGEATERIREETEKAYESSGLTLNDDQREVFALRYRQERRRLERELQDKAKAERARRLPEIMERLKHEFPAPGPAPVSTPKPTPTPPPTPAK